MPSGAGGSAAPFPHDPTMGCPDGSSPLAGWFTSYSAYGALRDARAIAPSGPRPEGRAGPSANPPSATPRTPNLFPLVAELKSTAPGPPRPTGPPSARGSGTGDDIGEEKFCETASLCKPPRIPGRPNTRAARRERGVGPHTDGRAADPFCGAPGFFRPLGVWPGVSGAPGHTHLCRTSVRGAPQGRTQRWTTLSGSRARSLGPIWISVPMLGQTPQS